MQIRKAQTNDLDQVIRLYQHLNPDDSPPSDSEIVSRTWKEILSSPRTHLYVVEEKNKELISTCILAVVPNLSRECAPYALIENVVTLKEFRNKGYATALLKHTLQVAWELGCYKVMLLTGSKRPETLALYEKVGFQSGKKTGFVAYP